MLTAAYVNRPYRHTTDRKSSGEFNTFLEGDFRESVGVLGLRGRATQARLVPPSSTYTNTRRGRPLTRLALISVVHTPEIQLRLPTNSVTSVESEPKGRLSLQLTPL